jgi:hypothetical protein
MYTPTKLINSSSLGDNCIDAKHCSKVFHVVSLGPIKSHLSDTSGEVRVLLLEHWYHFVTYIVIQRRILFRESCIPKPLILPKTYM